MLGPDAEVGVDARVGKPRPQAGEALGPGGAIGLRPGRALAIRGRRGEISRLGEPTGHM